MIGNWFSRFNRDGDPDLLFTIIIPTFLSLCLMFFSYLGVGLILATDSSLVLGNIFTRILALIAILGIPPFIIGLLVGHLKSVYTTTAVAVGLAPIIFLTLALAVFQGPVLTPVAAPGLTLGAILMWSVICLLGMQIGTMISHIR